MNAGFRHKNKRIQHMEKDNNRPFSTCCLQNPKVDAYLAIVDSCSQICLYQQVNARLRRLESHSATTSMIVHLELTTSFIHESRLVTTIKSTHSTRHSTTFHKTKDKLRRLCITIGGPQTISFQPHVVGLQRKYSF